MFTYNITSSATMTSVANNNSKLAVLSHEKKENLRSSSFIKHEQLVSIPSPNAPRKRRRTTVHVADEASAASAAKSGAQLSPSDIKMFATEKDLVDAQNHLRRLDPGMTEDVEVCWGSQQGGHSWRCCAWCAALAPLIDAHGLPLKLLSQPDTTCFMALAKRWVCSTNLNISCFASLPAFVDVSSFACIDLCAASCFNS